jgi:hypothetical protein
MVVFVAVIAFEVLSHHPVLKLDHPHLFSIIMTSWMLSIES